MIVRRTYDWISTLRGQLSYADVEFRFDDGVVVEMHASVLASASPLLAQLLAEQHTACCLQPIAIYVPDLKLETFQLLASLLYEGHVDCGTLAKYAALMELMKALDINIEKQQNKRTSAASATSTASAKATPARVKPSRIENEPSGLVDQEQRQESASSSNTIAKRKAKQTANSQNTNSQNADNRPPPRPQGRNSSSGIEAADTPNSAHRKGRAPLPCDEAFLTEKLDNLDVAAIAKRIEKGMFKCFLCGLCISDAALLRAHLTLHFRHRLAPKLDAVVTTASKKKGLCPLCPNGRRLRLDNEVSRLQHFGNVHRFLADLLPPPIAQALFKSNRNQEEEADSTDEAGPPPTKKALLSGTGRSNTSDSDNATVNRPQNAGAFETSLTARIAESDNDIAKRSLESVNDDAGDVMARESSSEEAQSASASSCFPRIILVHSLIESGSPKPKESEIDSPRDILPEQPPTADLDPLASAPSALAPSASNLDQMTSAAPSALVCSAFNVDQMTSATATENNAEKQKSKETTANEGLSSPTTALTPSTSAPTAPAKPDPIASASPTKDSHEKNTPKKVANESSSSLSATSGSTDKRTSSSSASTNSGANDIITIAFDGYSLSCKSGKYGGDEAKWYSCLKCDEAFDKLSEMDDHRATCQKRA